MTPLNRATLAMLPPLVAGPGYDRGQARAGIAHLSIGNFHRAHQAWYIDRLLDRQPDWGISGIGLMDTPAERAKMAALAGQDGLYTLAQFDPEGGVTRQVIGAIVETRFAPDDVESVLHRLTDPRIRIVSLTVTEGGYNQDSAGRYRLEAPAVLADLAAPERPGTAFGVIVAALRRRRAAGVGPFTVMSCDNLRNNGGVTREAVVSHARALDFALADWIDAQVTFPNAMVDRITPAVGRDERQRLNDACGIDDAVPVFAESFAQWVIEDSFCAGRPDWEQVGVQMVADVHPYELAKLHMLNASHSMLAYPACLAGIARVDAALAEPLIHRLLDQFMAHDAIPLLHEPPGMDLHDYKAMLLSRFANPAIGDQVSRLCGGGAAKLPVFLGPVLRDVLGRGGAPRRIAFVLACFLRYLGGVDDHGHGFTPDHTGLTAADRMLAADADPHAALRMALLRDLGVTGAAAEAVVALRQDIARQGAMTTLRQIVGPA